MLWLASCACVSRVLSGLGRWPNTYNVRYYAYSDMGAVDLGATPAYIAAGVNPTTAPWYTTVSGFTTSPATYVAGANNGASPLGGGTARAAAGATVYSVPIVDVLGNTQAVVTATNAARDTLPGQSQCLLNAWASGAAASAARASFKDVATFSNLDSSLGAWHV